jgi:hypothetical protein
MGPDEMIRYFSFLCFSPFGFASVRRSVAVFNI